MFGIAMGVEKPDLRLLGGEAAADQQEMDRGIMGEDNPHEDSSSDDELMASVSLLNESKESLRLWGVVAK